MSRGSVQAKNRFYNHGFVFNNSAIFRFCRTNNDNETLTRVRRDPNGLKLPMSPSGKT